MDEFPYDSTFQAEEDWHGQHDTSAANQKAWMEAVRDLSAAVDQYQFALGDALVYGQNRFYGCGDSFYAHVARELGKDEETLRHLVYVARRVPACLRKHKPDLLGRALTYSHYAVAAVGETPELVEEYLNLAFHPRCGRLSVRAFRKGIARLRAGHSATACKKGRDTAPFTIRVDKQLAKDVYILAKMKGLDVDELIASILLPALQAWRGDDAVKGDLAHAWQLFGPQRKPKKVRQPHKSKPYKYDPESAISAELWRTRQENLTPDEFFARLQQDYRHAKLTRELRRVAESNPDFVARFGKQEAA